MQTVGLCNTYWDAGKGNLTAQYKKTFGGRGSAPDPAKGAYKAPANPLVGRGWLSPPQEPHLSAVGPSGLASPNPHFKISSDAIDCDQRQTDRKRLSQTNGEQVIRQQPPQLSRWRQRYPCEVCLPAPRRGMARWYRPTMRTGKVLQGVCTEFYILQWASAETAAVAVFPCRALIQIVASDVNKTKFLRPRPIYFGHKPVMS